MDGMIWDDLDFMGLYYTKLDGSFVLLMPYDSLILARGSTLFNQQPKFLDLRIRIVGLPGSMEQGPF